MTPDQFVTDAVRTESKIDEVRLYRNAFINTAAAIVALGEVLDQIKKNVFYNKPFKLDVLKDKVAIAEQATEQLKWAIHYDNISFPGSEAKDACKVNPRIFHSIVGCVTEAVELLQTIDLDDDGYDKINLMEEFGDLNWYVAIGLNETDSGFEMTLDAVIAKLRARYPDKFNSEAAINRDLEKERKVLEGNATTI